MSHRATVGILLALCVLLCGMIWLEYDNPCVRWSEKDELMIISVDPPTMIWQKACLERKRP